MPINEYLVGWVAVAEADHHQPFPQQFHLRRWQIGGRDDDNRQKDVEKDFLLRDQLVNQQVEVGGGAGNGGDEDEKSRVRENRFQLARLEQLETRPTNARSTCETRSRAVWNWKRMNGTSFMRA